jgi:hypothetical protein
MRRTAVGSTVAGGGNAARSMGGHRYDAGPSVVYVA